MKITQVVNQLLEDDVRQDMNEASVYLPPRSTIWLGVFTGPDPGIQIRRSTGVRDKETALAIAREWEAQAREQRLARPRLSSPRQAPGGLSQREIAALLRMSERAVRNIEKRALAKLRQHPALREFWGEYVGHTVEHSGVRLATEEIEALLGLARSAQEESLVRRLIIDLLLA